MSTKSIALFSTFQKTAHPRKFSAGLSTLLLPSGIERGVFVKEITDPKLRIMVRPFSVAMDLPILYKWMCQEYAGPLVVHSRPPKELEESYTSMIASDFAQPFMGMVNDLPVCQMDVYKTRQDVLSLNYNARTGDYGLRLAVAPLAVQDNMVMLIKTCLDHFFTFPEVERIIVDIDSESDYNNELFRSAGFRPMHQLKTAYRASSLFVYTRR